MARPITLFTGQWADLPFEEVARLAGDWGYDGLETACWTITWIPGRWNDDAYVQEKLDILERHGLKVWTIANHLKGQAVCDDPIDERHRGILPDAVWGDGDPEEVPRRAAEELKNTARLVAKLGVKTVTGLRARPSGSTWPCSRPPPKRWSTPTTRTSPTGGTPSSMFSTKSVSALPTRYTRPRSRTTTGPRSGLMEAIGHREAIGLNWEPSHMVWQDIDPVGFLWDFKDRIYHVHCKDTKKRLSNGRNGRLSSHLAWAVPRRGWDFISTGHGDVPWEDAFRMLNSIGYRGPLSVEWEDAGMDRMDGAPEVLAFVRRLSSYEPSAAAFEAAFSTK